MSLAPLRGKALCHLGNNSLRLCHCRDNCLLAAVSMMVKWVTGKDWPIRGVSLPHAQPANCHHSRREMEMRQAGTTRIPKVWIQTADFFKFSCQIQKLDRRIDKNTERNQKCLACKAPGHYCEFSQLLCAGALCAVFLHTPCSLCGVMKAVTLLWRHRGSFCAVWNL